MPPAAPYTLPEPGVIWLTRARSRYLSRVARLLFEPTGLPPWLVGAWAGVRDPLVEVFKRSGPEFLGALSLPSVAAPLCAGRIDVGIPQLLLELSRRRVLGREGVWWPGPIDMLVCAPRGLVRRYTPPLVGALFGDGDVEVSEGVPWEVGAERAFVPLAAGGWLALVDNNPLAHVEAHPDKQGNGLSLGDVAAEGWVDAINAARALVQLALPALAQEHASVLAHVVPVGVEPERSLSASYREAIGVVYVSLHPKPAVMAEALIHEVQHNKLNMVSWSDPLIHDDGSLHVSPVRPDPRPLLGVLLAAHAFLPVAELHLSLLAQGHPAGDPERLAAVMRQNEEALEVLRAARPTDVGRAVIEGMRLLAADQRLRADQRPRNT